MKVISMILFLLVSVGALYGQFEIQNAVAIPDTGRVTITYDLIHPTNKLCKISVMVSNNGGSTYGMIPTALSGDVGVVAPGNGKEIVWFTAQDHIASGNQYRVKIVADDDFRIQVRGGTFNNGTADVTISSYYLDKKEVTQFDYQTVMGFWEPDPSDANNYGTGFNYPVYNVSWFNAIEYCNRKSIREGLDPCYSYSTAGTNPANWPVGWDANMMNHYEINCDWSADGYRLPTEMEWMFAAKGGVVSGNYIYSGSNNINAVAWYFGNSENTTHLVGLKVANELGLLDMSGNIGEWVWDIYGTYHSEAQIDPTGTTDGSFRTLRGGNWNSDASICTTSFRSHSEASSKSNSVGFRCAQMITEYLFVSTPIFNPPAGVYPAAFNVTITCGTEGASIHYTTDGSDPTESSPVYSAPIPINTDAILKAKAYKLGWNASSIAVANYGISPISENFVHVQGGVFHNGTSGVHLSSFYIDKYELTQADFMDIMGPWDLDPIGNGDIGVGDDFPIYYVSWYNAIEYCNRRSLLEGLTPCYGYSSFGADPANWPLGWDDINQWENHTAFSCNWNANGYRLPTEMEWMFAARGGNLSQNYTYSGGNVLGKVAWFIDNSYNLGTEHPDYGVHSVGSKNPNELGLYDMTGNVREWVWDIYAYQYPSNTQTNPTGASFGPYRVFRGGSWKSVDYECGITFRNAGVATYPDNNLGFRCVRVLQ